MDVTDKFMITITGELKNPLCFKNFNTYEAVTISTPQIMAYIKRIMKWAGNLNCMMSKCGRKKLCLLDTPLVTKRNIFSDVKLLNSTEFNRFSSMVRCWDN